MTLFNSILKNVPVRSVHRLKIMYRIPRGIKNHHTIRRLQVNAHVPRFGGNKHQLVLGIVVETVNGLLSIAAYAIDT